MPLVPLRPLRPAAWVAVPGVRGGEVRLPQKEARRVRCAAGAVLRTSFRRRGARGIGRLPRMARRRVRARVNWGVRWGGAALGCGFLAMIPWSAFRASALVINVPRGEIDIAARSGVAFLAFTRARPSWFPPSLPLPAAPPPWSAAVYDSSRGDGQEWRWWRWHAKKWPESPPGFSSGGELAGTAVTLEFPLWCPAVLSLGASVWAYADWRSRRGPAKCSSCRYDLSGLPPGSACPECAAVCSP